MSTNTLRRRGLASLIVGLAAILATFTIVGVWSDYALASVGLAFRILGVSLLMLLGPGGIALWAYMTGKHEASRPAITHTDLSTRITVLASQLTNSLDLITSIEGEVKARQELVEQLESQKKIAEAAVSLTKSQVDALAQLLNIELQKGDKRSAARDYILFAAGIFVSLVITVILKSLGLP